MHTPCLKWWIQSSMLFIQSSTTSDIDDKGRRKDGQWKKNLRKEGGQGNLSCFLCHSKNRNHCCKQTWAICQNIPKKGAHNSSFYVCASFALMSTDCSDGVPLNSFTRRSLETLHGAIQLTRLFSCQLAHICPWGRTQILRKFSGRYRVTLLVCACFELRSTVLVGKVWIFFSPSMAFA